VIENGGKRGTEGEAHAGRRGDRARETEKETRTREGEEDSHTRPKYTKCSDKSISGEKRSGKRGYELYSNAASDKQR